MRFGVGLATGEGDLLTEARAAASASFDQDPDLALVFATPDAAGLLEGLNGPGRTVGCIADAVIGGRTEAEHGPTVVVWQASLGDVPWTISRIRAIRDGTATSIRGWRHPDRPSGAIVLTDPPSFPTQGFVEELGSHGIPTIGGLATSSYGTRLMIDGTVDQTGGVAIAFGPGISFTTTVSQGCRPIGRPGVVTNVRGHHIFEIGGRPAFEFLGDVVRELDEDDLTLARQGLQLGIVVDEYKTVFGVGDFLIRPVLGADQELGYVAAGGPVTIGQTVQLHVRDPDSAAGELKTMLSDTPTRPDAGALLFTCNARGSRFFGRPNHDAELVDTLRTPQALAGIFAAGEIGPVGGINHLHGYTASLLELSPA